MNTEYNPQQRAILENRYGLRLAARLSAGSEHLPHDVEERLRVARQQAMARRKQPTLLARRRLAPALSNLGGTAALGFGDDALGFWGRLTSGVLVAAMAVALVVINVVETDKNATELAEVDAALLTDDLPPQAYTDPGFLQYMKTATDDRSSSE